MKMVTAEDKILLWVAASGDPEAGAPARLPERLGAEQSVRLVDAAVREGLAGLLYQRLKTSGRLKALGDPARDRLEAIYYLTIQTNLKFFAALKEIVQEGVPFVLMQGAALLADIYLDPGLRPLSDIDLWVLPRDRDRLLTVLSGLGFEENPLVPGVLRRGAVLVDVHTQLDWAERIPATRFLFALDPEEIQGSCRRITWDGLQLSCLGGHDQVIYLTVHAVKHNLERLIWLADVQRLTAAWQASEWEELRQRARQIGQERVPALLAYLRQELFGMSTPAAATAGLTLSAGQRYLLRMRKRGPLPKWSSLALLTAGNRVRQLEFALESMFPRPEVLRQVFADRRDLSDWQLYGLRVRQLLGMMR
jgi:Uncharacterised nucleotidyltransferase